MAFTSRAPSANACVLLIDILTMTGMMYDGGSGSHSDDSEPHFGGTMKSAISGARQNHNRPPGTLRL